MRYLYLTSCFVVLGLWGSAAPAQPPEGFGGRGGDFGGRGGDRGGDRGDRGERGGDRGDGERGGFGRRGGFERGGRGGPGGFDPSSFIDRLDRNNNGMLDTDEMEGPARFMIQRLQRDDPSINPDRPIPMSKLKEGFERMRGGRGGDDDDRRGGGDDDDEAAMVVGELVPGFGGVELPPIVPGFGATAELLAVRVTDADLREAEENLRRYDRDKDGFVGADELSRRWEGNPMDFDQNRDNKLSASELAVRYARRRLSRAESETSRDDRNRRREESGAEVPEVEDRFGGRQSYRRTTPESPEGMPGWFSEKDRDRDGQVMMNEYEEDWSDEKVAEFFSYDFNRDGILTADEVLRALKSGPSPSVAATATAAESRSSRATGATPSSRAEGITPVSPGNLDAKYVQYAERIISRSDSDSNKVLTVDEWKTMILDVSPADADRDGRITIPEYAGWMQARAQQ